MTGGSDAKESNLMMDMDWDTALWNLREIETACGTLIDECGRASCCALGQKRRHFAEKMLVRLVRRHHEARAYVERHLENLVHHAFPGAVVEPRGPGQAASLDHDEALNLAPLLKALAPLDQFASRLLECRAVRRVVAELLIVPTLAAKLVQNRVQMRVFCNPSKWRDNHLTHHLTDSKLTDAERETRTEHRLRRRTQRVETSLSLSLGFQGFGKSASSLLESRGALCVCDLSTLPLQRFYGRCRLKRHWFGHCLESHALVKGRRLSIVSIV